MTTFGHQLAAHRGIGPGFDAVRMGLALSVLFVHAASLHAAGTDDIGLPLFPGAPVGFWTFATAILPMFFALSGFLVASSAERISLGQFLINRGLRIFPALTVEIVLSALLLGPLLTDLSLGAYFGDPRLPHYFLNILGDIHYELPGLFLGNRATGIVNGSLWTVPHELSCYALLTAAILAGAFRRRDIMLGATLALFAIAVAVDLCGRFGVSLPHREALTYFFVTRGAARLVPLFLTGILFYQFRDRIPYRGDLALAGLGLYLGACSFGSPDWANAPIFNALAAPVLTYATLYAGLSPRFSIRWLAKGDYSYGLYLYGFPIQQAIAQVAPGIDATATFFVTSALATGCLAAVSWHLIEKPVLRLRRRFSVTARIHTDPPAAEASAPADLPARALSPLATSA